MALLGAAALMLAAAGCGGGDSTSTTSSAVPKSLRVKPIKPATDNGKKGGSKQQPTGSSANAGSGGTTSTTTTTGTTTSAVTGGPLDTKEQAKRVKELTDALRSPQGQRFRQCIRDHGATPPPLPTNKQIKIYEQNGFGSGSSGGGKFGGKQSKGPGFNQTPKQRKQLQKAYSDPDALQAAREACADQAPPGVMGG